MHDLSRTCTSVSYHVLLLRLYILYYVLFVMIAILTDLEYYVPTTDCPSYLDKLPTTPQSNSSGSSQISDFQTIIKNKKTINQMTFDQNSPVRTELGMESVLGSLAACVDQKSPYYVAAVIIPLPVLRTTTRAKDPLDAFNDGADICLLLSFPLLRYVTLFQSIVTEYWISRVERNTTAFHQDSVQGAGC